MICLCKVTYIHLNKCASLSTIFFFNLLLTQGFIWFFLHTYEVIEHFIRILKHIFDSFIVDIHRCIQKFRCEFPKTHIRIFSYLRIDNTYRQFESISQVYFLANVFGTPLRANYSMS